ncbi:6-carboxyhexanoate--CoA ligase [Aneurinibacillus uraniidurans]|uniref:6-carboxyhexanoate--CoA ligase n=1 Tax=Aneurinibacillus uraniidurans TaxID=2966586 RepID=UPI00234BD143|nr:6-carboxyhexanoate--CoA ligase [Aneurinibacillus sp. B1]WCN36292.1 6-carboxyhexanoate--CoA ligase [Aneurinibacillus sp. B1]
MENPSLYSLRMRAAQGGAHECGGLHISGGERLSTAEEVETLVSQLLHKAMSHSRGTADFISIVMEKVDQKEVECLSPLPVSTYDVHTPEEGRRQAAILLKQLFVSDTAIQNGLDLLASSHNWRGAILLDSQSGERIDHRGDRGIRVSRMDWEKSKHRLWQNQHPSFTSSRIAEAIALATKVARSPYTVAELCWSDDPEYVTGYVGSCELGYCRISHLKRKGELSGGRIFFVKEGTDIESYIEYLERKPVWIG